ncbi:hypothetical protein Q8A73_019357 [Channa argus]|nr:hypothetical protein Q8A73_019357 [Channa argus]
MRRFSVTLILHYPQPTASGHVVGNPFAADYCNPTEGLDDTSDHDRKKSESSAACNKCSCYDNKGINLGYDLTHSSVLLQPEIGGARAVSWTDPLSSSPTRLGSAALSADWSAAAHTQLASAASSVQLAS